MSGWHHLVRPQGSRMSEENQHLSHESVAFVFFRGGGPMTLFYMKYHWIPVVPKEKFCVI